MQSVDVSIMIQSLKDDLNALSSLSYAERTTHLGHVSKPLIRSLFLVLNHEIDELTNNQIIYLCDYLVDYLGFNNDIAIESLMCLYRLKSIEDNLHDILNNKIDNLLQIQSTQSDTFKIIKILAHLFTFDPVVSSEIFNRNSLFINLVTNETTNLSNKLDDDTPNSQFIKNLNCLLILFSNACVDEISRSLIASMYFNLILKCLSLTKVELQQSKCYANTTTIKLWRLIKPETFENNSQLLSLNNLLEINLKSLENALETSVEGLSLLCTNVKIRQKVRNEKILNVLLKLLEEKEHTKYGVITIFSLLTLPNRIIQVEQKSIMRLKDSNSFHNYDIYTSKKLNNSELQDDKNQIDYIINQLIEKKFVSQKLSIIFKSLKSSKGLVGECVKLMHNIIFPDSVCEISQDDDNEKDKEFQKAYIIEIKQIINLLTTYLLSVSRNIEFSRTSFTEFKDKSIEFSQEDLEVRSIAIKALTSPYISIHVNEIFKSEDENNEESASYLVPFIMEILIQHDIDLGTALESKKTPFTSIKKQLFSSFDVYYSITSLAALASLDYTKVKEMIFICAFDSIINLLSSNNWKIQFSSLQLLDQITSLPLCLAKIFNWDSKENENYQNFAILCHLILSEKIEIQELSLSLFYSCCKFSIISSKLAESELFCQNLSKLLTIPNLEPDLQHYALLVLSIMLNGKENIPNNKLDVFDNNKGLIVELADENNEIGETASKILEYF